MTNDRSASSPLPHAAIEALRQGNKIEAIKLVRLDRGTDLKDSKHAVEAYLRTQPDLQRQLEAAQAEARSGFLKWAVVLLVALAIAYFFFHK